MFDEKILNDLKSLKNKLIDNDEKLQISFRYACEIRDVYKLQFEFYKECDSLIVLLEEYFTNLNVFISTYNYFKSFYLNRNRERFDIVNRIIATDLKQFITNGFNKIESVLYMLSWIADDVIFLTNCKSRLEKLYEKQKEIILN